MSLPAAHVGVAPKFILSRPASSLKAMVLEWRRRNRSRNELVRLADRDRRDLGYSNCDVDVETSKPFWNP